jgi:hypothetical protein
VSKIGSPGIEVAQRSIDAMQTTIHFAMSLSGKPKIFNACPHFRFSTMPDTWLLFRLKLVGSDFARKKAGK